MQMGRNLNVKSLDVFYLYCFVLSERREENLHNSNEPQINIHTHKNEGFDTLNEFTFI